MDTSAKRNILSAQTNVEISGTQQKFWILIFICAHAQSHIFKNIWLIQKIFLHKLLKVEDILNQK